MHAFGETGNEATCDHNVMFVTSLSQACNSLSQHCNISPLHHNLVTRLHMFINDIHVDKNPRKGIVFHSTQVSVVISESTVVLSM